MAVLVIDSSITAAWCLKEETTAYTEGILSAVSGLIEAAAPRLWAYEVRNCVLMGMRRKRITQADADGFLGSLPDLRIRLTDPVSYDELSIWRGGSDSPSTTPPYLDLALREGLPLATLDDDLIRAAQQSGVAIFHP
jgi:predicted nucleic acid-binding protein